MSEPEQARAQARGRYWRAIGILYPVGLIVMVLEFLFVYPVRAEPARLIGGLLAGICLFGLIQGLIGLWAGAIPKIETGAEEFAYGWDASLRAYIQASVLLLIGLAGLALFLS